MVGKKISYQCFQAGSATVGISKTIGIGISTIIDIGSIIGISFLPFILVLVLPLGLILLFVLVLLLVFLVAHRFRRVRGHWQGGGAREGLSAHATQLLAVSQVFRRFGPGLVVRWTKVMGAKDKGYGG